MFITLIFLKSIFHTLLYNNYHIQNHILTVLLSFFFSFRENKHLQMFFTTWFLSKHLFISKFSSDRKRASNVLSPFSPMYSQVFPRQSAPLLLWDQSNSPCFLHYHHGFEHIDAFQLGRQDDSVFTSDKFYMSRDQLLSLVLSFRILTCS